MRPIESQVELQDVDARRRADDRARVIDRPGQQLADLSFGNLTSGGNTTNLVLRGFRADVGVETRTRGSDQIHRNRPFRSRLQRLDPLDDFLAEVRVLGAQVGPASGIGLVVDRRGAGLEITVGRERLGNQLRADHRAVVIVDEAPLRLMREGQLGQPPDHRRVSDGAENEGDKTRQQGTHGFTDHDG